MACVTGITEAPLNHEQGDIYLKKPETVDIHLTDMAIWGGGKQHSGNPQWPDTEPGRG